MAIMTLRTKALSLTGATIFVALFGSVLLVALIAPQISADRLVQALFTATIVGLIVTLPTIYLSARASAQIETLQNRLGDLVTTDELTGLSNRRAFEAHYAHERARSERTADTMCLLMLQVDRTEQHIQNYGQAGYEKLVVHLADYLSLTLRSGTDKVARWSDNEFVVLLTETPYQGGLTTAERLHQRIEGLNIQLNDAKVRLTVSVGVVTCRPGELLESALEKMDECMISAHRLGPNTIVPYTEPQPELVVVAG